MAAVEEYRAGLVQDKGGADNVSVGEMRMIELAATARACVMLIFGYTSKLGFVRLIGKSVGQWDLSPAVKELSRFMNVERQALQVLGLARRQKVLTLQELLMQGDDGDDDQGDGGSDQAGEG